MQYRQVARSSLQPHPTYSPRGAERPIGQTIGEDRRRFFIVAHEPSGSGLLAAILDACGADFGDVGSDAGRDRWESPSIDRAIRHAHTANRFSSAMRGLGSAVYGFWWSRAKAQLEAGLRDAPYSRNRGNAAALPLAEQLDYRPVVIVSYRHPAEVALSDMQTDTPSAFMASITRTYRDALYALQQYGGVVIDHADVTDPTRDQWAHALETVTGLDAGRLLAARRRLLKPQPYWYDDQLVWLPSDLRVVAQNLASRRNLPVEGSQRARYG